MVSVFPCLNEVIVEECPRMKLFSTGQRLNTPKLQSVCLEESCEGNREIWEGNLNATIQQLHNEEDPIQDQSLSTPMDIPSISQAQMDGFSTDQNKTIPPSSTEQGVNMCERPPSDICKDHLPEDNMTQIRSTDQHSGAIAESDQLSDAIATPYAAPEPETMSTSESKNRTHSSLELTSSLSSKPTSKPPSFPITEIESMNHATSSKKPPNITPLSFQPALSLITPAESCNSIPETKGYSMSMQVMKNVLSKPLTEVASSTDRVLLLSTLKNLRNWQSHLLNAEQTEAIQVFIENFDSIVAYHPIHENQIEQAGAFKLSFEDKEKGISMLKNRYEDLAQKSTSLAAEKEALIKRLGEIEEEEDKIREDMEDVQAKIVTDGGTLEEAYMFFLPELDREKKEAEAKVCTSNSQWAKMRSLFT